MCRWNIHRVAVLDGGGEVDGMVSQSDVIGFVSNGLAAMFPDLSVAGIEQERVGNWDKVFSVTSKDPAMAAFELIHDLKVHGVAVVDAENGKLIGNISASDLRVIGSSGHSMSLLDQTCGAMVAMAA